MNQQSFHIAFLMVFFLSPITSDIRANSISIRIGWQLLPQNTSRPSYTTLSAFNFRICQMKCLLQSSCQVAVFRQSSLSCDLFTNISMPIDNLLVPADPRTITIIIYNQVSASEYISQPLSKSNAIQNISQCKFIFMLST